MPGVSALSAPKGAGLVRGVMHAVPPGDGGEQLRGKDGAGRKSQAWSEESIAANIEHQRDVSFSLAKATKTPIAWARALQAAEVAEDKDSSLLAAREVFRTLRNAMPRASDKSIAELAGQALLRILPTEEAKSELDALEAVRPELLSARLRAIVAGKMNDASKALSVLENAPSEALDLKAYFELQLDMPDRAIRDLRELVRTRRDSPGDRMNLAFAYWQVGSYNKALRAALEAARMAPGRKDVSLECLRMLLGAGKVASVELEIRKLKMNGVDDADLLRIEVDVLDARDDIPGALRLLKRIQSREDSSESLRVECGLYESVLESRVGVIDRQVAFQKVRRYCDAVAPSTLLVDWLIEVADKRQDAEIALAHFEAVKNDFVPTYRLRLESQLAFLLHDWPRSLERAYELLRIDPLNEFAVGNVGMIEGHIHEDWAAAIRNVERMRSNGRLRTPYMINQAAYFLASAGRGEEALEILRSARSLDPVMLATRGLARIASGDFAGGTKDYRDAFLAVPAGPRQANLRALMAISEVQGMYRLGIPGVQDDVTMIGSALPVSEIDNVDGFDASLALLKECARRNGWPWPTLL